MKVTAVGTSAGSLYVTGNLVTAIVRGTGGVLPNAGAADTNSNLANLSVGTVKLVQ